MRLLIHDLPEKWDEILRPKAEEVFRADGNYAPCQGCFGCWTKHPANCFMKDKLQMICRKFGKADELIIITENHYGSYSAAIKNVMDRTIGLSTPFMTYRNGMTHHTLRYGKKKKLTVYVYGDMTEDEKNTFRLLLESNAVNFGYKEMELHCAASPEELEGVMA